MRLLLLGLAAMAGACVSPAALKRDLSNAETKFKDHIGFALYDPASRRTLLEYQSDKYFTPASNTKIFTFYTALQVLGDSIPAFQYTIRNDSMIFRGTGDPSFLYRATFANPRVYEILRNAPQRLFFSSTNFQTEHFGPGWAWDDYPYAYSAERSAFPVYGNLVDVSESPAGNWSTLPKLFSNHLIAGDSATGDTELIRNVATNELVIHPGNRGITNLWSVPFHTSNELLMELLSDTLKRPVEEIDEPLPDSAWTQYSVPADSLYSVMMQESDNFIAEQLLLVCAGVLSDTLNPDIAIRYSTRNLLFDLPDKPVWVDGSGLSRYNLFTPRSIVRLWEKVYEKVPQERLFKLLAVGGKSGTIKKSYNGTDKPYIFGKTGSLSNNHTLSGYVLTKKGKILIFSFMNANFIASQREIRNTMQDFLLKIRDRY